MEDERSKRRMKRRWRKGTFKKAHRPEDEDQERKHEEDEDDEKDENQDEREGGGANGESDGGGADGSNEEDENNTSDREREHGNNEHEQQSNDDDDMLRFSSASLRKSDVWRRCRVRMVLVIFGLVTEEWLHILRRRLSTSARGGHAGQC